MPSHISAFHPQQISLLHATSHCSLLTFMSQFKCRFLKTAFFFHNTLLYHYTQTASPLPSKDHRCSCYLFVSLLVYCLRQLQARSRFYPEYIKNFKNSIIRKLTTQLKICKDLTATSPKKIYGWQVST